MFLRFMPKVDFLSIALTGQFKEGMSRSWLARQTKG